MILNGGTSENIQLFLKKNRDAPFQVKKEVLESAMKGVILYGCESWLCDNMQPADSAIVSAQKQLLGVRTQTCTDLVRLELSSASAKSLVQKRQRSYFQKLMLKSDFRQSPISKAIDLAQSARSPAGRYMQSLMNGTDKPVEKELECMKAKVRQSDSSRRKTYLLFNPELITHRIYADSTVSESDRVAFSRIRLGSHYLKIETGRWSRIERDRRLCQCGQIQTEEHVLLHCPLTLDIRARYSQLCFSSLSALMANDDFKEVAKFSREALHKTYENMSIENMSM